MKRCHICQIEKPLEDFNKNKAKKDGLSHRCRECSKKLAKEDYHKNKGNRLESIYANRHIRQNTSYDFVEMVKLFYGCQSCHKILPSCCLDFHHYYPDKKNFLIPEGVHFGYGLDTIIQEIEKCIVLCANCHRKLHGGILVIGEDAICKNVKSLSYT